MVAGNELSSCKLSATNNVANGQWRWTIAVAMLCEANHSQLIELECTLSSWLVHDRHFCHIQLDYHKSQLWLASTNKLVCTFNVPLTRIVHLLYILRSGLLYRLQKITYIEFQVNLTVLFGIIAFCLLLLVE